MSLSSIKKSTIDDIIRFRDERGWKQFNNPKDLSISISLEAAELLEIFQWSGKDISAEGKIDKIKEELADVLIYAVYLADECGLDINTIIEEKLQRNGEKYPVDKAFGKKDKYNQL